MQIPDHFILQHWTKDATYQKILRRVHAQQKASSLVDLAEESGNLYKFIILEFGNLRVSAMKMKANLSFDDRVQYFLEFTVQVSEHR